MISQQRQFNSIYNLQNFLHNLFLLALNETMMIVIIKYNLDYNPGLWYHTTSEVDVME